MIPTNSISKPSFTATARWPKWRAMEIKNVLEANGIAAIVVGNSVLPTMSFEVRVARDQVERAREVIREAQAGGPKAAEEAEALFESRSQIPPKV